MSARAVVGREVELAAIDGFVGEVVRAPATLLIEGEPGIGKTTLWQEAVQRAEERGVCVLRSRPGPSETQLTFVGLGDFVRAVEPKVLDELPAPQRRALDVALLDAEPDGSSPDQRSVSTAFLSVLRVLARAGPVVVAVDDVQWLDAQSWKVLEFALRRREGEPIGLLAAVRLGGDTWSRRAAGHVFAESGVRRIRLGGLNLAAVHEMLKAALGQSFARPVLVRIQQTSSGNPFFALELARALVERGGPISGSVPLPVPHDLVELLEQRLRRLPVRSRQALLVAAALSRPTLDLLDRPAVARAEEAGVLRVDVSGRVAFTHPLLASAVYGSVPTSRRREVHRELAGRVSDPEERARHLALGTEQADERVAAALAEAARSVHERGAPDAAIELLERACELTPTDDREAVLVRRFELARSRAAAGDAERSAHELRELIAEAPPGALRAKARVILAFLSAWMGSEQLEMCEQALAEAGDDPALRAELHAVTSRLCDHDVERKWFHARAALALVESAIGDPSLHAYALLAVAEAEFYTGRGIARELFERAAAFESEAESDGSSGSSKLLLGALHSHSGLRLSARLLGVLQLHADEFDAARAALERERRLTADYGDEVQLARTLCRLATVELWTGNWPVAERHLRELEGIIERTGQEGVRATALTLEARLSALRGDVDQARAEGGRALALSIAADDEWQILESVAALGFVELSSGDHAAARAQLDHADEIDTRIGFKEPGMGRHHADHIESLIALGELEPAEAALERLEQHAHATGRPRALATGARCRGLLLAARGELEGAAAALERALAEHERLPIPFELGRTLLVQGQIERRLKHKRQAKEALEQAAALFEQLGTRLWAKKARAELERVAPPPSAGGRLSATEARVAALAATGSTNREVAATLFMSPKTVEANLARIYQKLGIHSRAELGAHLAGNAATETK